MSYSILKTAGAVAAGLIAAETGMRLFTEPVEASTVHHRLFCEFDPQLGWRKKTNSSGFHITTEYQVFERLNSCGLRGREHSFARRSGEYRILFLGDSFTEGYSVHQHHLFSSRLERDLNCGGHDGRHYCCINAGTGGYSTDQEWLFFLSEGKRYQPDLTVLMFYENDILDNIAKVTHRGTEKPVFQVKNDCLEAENLPLSPPGLTPKAEGPEALWVRMIQKSYLLGHLTNSLRQFSMIAELIQRRIASRRPGYTVPQDLWIWAEEAPEKVENAWRLTRALIRALRQNVEETGSRFLVFLVPQEASIYSELWRAMQNMWAIPGHGWDVNVTARRMTELCRQESIALIDPSLEFRAQAARLARRGKRLYYPVDGHWTSDGHSLVADILRERILQLED
jgi:lysophospholipase L1-like esterase